jgi:hypothetical protein
MASNVLIRLLDGDKLLDCVDGQYEDSISIESFSSIIQAHEECEPKGTKHSIIARVQTWDKKQPEKAYYSYYDAYQLNKILFKTQVYLNQKVIHRLQVLNPLTNTDIIGNVLYFIIDKGDEEHSEHPLTDPKPTCQEIEKTAVMQECKVNVQEDDTSETGNLINRPVPKRKMVAANLRIDIGKERKQQNWTLAKPVVCKLEEKTHSSSPLSAPADMLVQMSLKIKKSVSSPLKQYQSNTSVEDLEQRDPEANVVVEEIKVKARGRQRSTTVSAVYKRPTEQALKLGRNADHFTSAPPGSATRFNMPISIPEENNNTEEQKTPPQRRRNMTLANSAIEPTEDVYKEWIRSICSPVASPSKTKPTDSQTPVAVDNQSTVPESANKIVVYTARLCGTDMEYMEKAELRDLFLRNTTNAEETKLLEMPPFNGIRNEGDVLLMFDNDNVCCGGGQREKTCMEFLVVFIVVVVLVIFIILLIRVLKK